mmetsp:Transcript_18941/g.52878  ORF Transcript_18941/g.52878 Transcript_18941/m.52878 type:complete len:233 (+) Transcript_18941:634-1332(+)
MGCDGPRARGLRGVRRRLVPGLLQGCRAAAARRGEPLRRFLRPRTVSQHAPALGFAAGLWLQASRRPHMANAAPGPALDPCRGQRARAGRCRTLGSEVPQHLRSTGCALAFIPVSELGLSYLCAAGLCGFGGMFHQRGLQRGVEEQPVDAAGGKRQRAHFLVPAAEKAYSASEDGRGPQDLEVAEAVALSCPAWFVCGTMASSERRGVHHELSDTGRGRGEAHAGQKGSGVR